MRLTAVFAAAMVLVLAGAAVFVYARLRDDLDEAIDESLAARAGALAVVAQRSGSDLGDAGPAALGEPDEAFSQVLGADGRVLAARGRVSGRALPPRLVRIGAREPVRVDMKVTGLDGTVRVLARPLPGTPGAVVVVGQSLGDRDETLTGLLVSFGIGGPIAVLVASLLGYGLATGTLRPVEAMRRRAAAVSLSAGDEALPLPEAHDEVRRLGETLNEMLDRLRRSFERERRFVADASHELRTPIAVLKTELETLLRRDHPPEMHDALVAAADEADHLARLAEDLLVLARASEGRLAVRPEPLDSHRVLASTRDRFGERAATEGRRIVVDAPAGLVLDADPMRLRQALGNLVDNALRHGGRDIVLAARAADGGVVVEVADGGHGFPAALGDRAFERFTRGDEARTRGGAGLGLSIVRAIADAHGGRASIASDPGGARVRLWLPAVPGIGWSQVHLSDGAQHARDTVTTPPQEENA
jgi:signal transduction histidine kinase